MIGFADGDEVKVKADQCKDKNDAVKYTYFHYVQGWVWDLFEVVTVLEVGFVFEIAATFYAAGQW